MPSATNHSIDAPREHQNTTKQQEKKSNLVGSCRWRRAAGGRAVCPRLPGRRPVLRRVIVALRGTPYASRASCVRGRSAIELDAFFSAALRPRSRSTRIAFDRRRAGPQLLPADPVRRRRAA